MLLLRWMVRKKDTPQSRLRQSGRTKRPLAKVENLPVDEVGTITSKLSETMCNCPNIIENPDIVLVCAITPCMQE
jgi:hypothetical protein